MNTLTLCFVASATASAIAAALIGPPDRYTQRAQGLATHANSLALVSVLALGPAIVLIIQSHRIVKLIWVIASGFLLWSILFASGSRAGVIGLVFIFALLQWFIGSRRTLLVALECLLLLVIALRLGFIDISGSESLGRLVGRGTEIQVSGAKQSDEGRLAALYLARDEFMKRPLIGSGLATARAAHNVYVSVLTSGGVIALIGLLLVLNQMFRSSQMLSRLKDRPDGSLVLLGMGWIAGYTGMMAANLFQNALWERFVWIPPIIAVMCLYSARKNLEFPLNKEG